MKKNRPLSKLEDYFNLNELMHCCRGTHEENRAFGLQHDALQNRPFAMLGAWMEKNAHRSARPDRGRTIVLFLRNSALALAAAAFALGILTAAGLLSYSGNAPVNVLYFLAVTVAFPLLGMLLSLLAMLRSNRRDAVLVHLLPAFWLQRILERFFGPDTAQPIPFNPLLANRLVIVRAQEFSLAFYAGLFLALLAIVAGKDIAFAWSSTLPLDAQTFHRLLSLIALPWRDWLPQAVPSRELIENSRYFRLGGMLDAQMVQQAARLGEWWKFLAMTTFFYGIALRLGMLAFARWAYGRALRRSILALEGVSELLREFGEPVITTQAHERENALKTDTALPDRILTAPLHRYDSAVGWALDTETIAFHNDRIGIRTDTVAEAGGMHSLQEDAHTVGNLRGDILIYVKAWEPPTMDFIDFLNALRARQPGKIHLYLLGLPQRDYRADDGALEVWVHKIAALNAGGIGIVR